MFFYKKGFLKQELKKENLSSDIIHYGFKREQ